MPLATNFVVSNKNINIEKNLLNSTKAQMSAGDLKDHANAIPSCQQEPIEQTMITDTTSQTIKFALENLMSDRFNEDQIVHSTQNLPINAKVIPDCEVDPMDQAQAKTSVDIFESTHVESMKVYQISATFLMI